MSDIPKRQWTRFFSEQISIDPDKKVSALDFKLLAEDFTGQINVTDFQVQGGQLPTADHPAISEWMDRKKGVLDERIATEGLSGDVDVLGDQPRVFENVANRFYNIVGRGHDVMVVPNVFETSFNETVLTTALDITLYAKNDFDLLRISTNYGTEIEGFNRTYDEDGHPLNTRYSREWWFDEGGKRGSEIKLHASTGTAEVDGVPSNRSARIIPVGDGEIETKKQRFMGVPMGSARIRIEFYKLKTETIERDFGDDVIRNIMRDSGIGFWGVAELSQWENRGRI